MSKKTMLLFLKLLTFAVTIYAFCGFQTSFWPCVFGALPSPQLWLIAVVYIALKWPNVRAVFFIYFIGLIITQYSYVPLKMIWTSLIFLTLFVWFFRNRIHSTSLFYFAVLATSSSLFFMVSYISISYWIENQPTPIYFVHRLIELGCNFLFSIPVYKFLDFLNTFLDASPEWSASSSSQSSTTEVES